MQSLKWEDLRYFLAVAQTGNLSKAARNLAVNHSTVFRRITSLEHSLSVRLFERLPEGYVLTSAGEEMLASVSQIDDEIASLDLRIRGQDHRLTGVLRVTTTDSLGHFFLQPHLFEFHQQYPDIRIELITDNSFSNITKRQADVAIRPTNTPPEGLVGRKACIIKWAIYGSKAYIKQHGMPESPQELGQHRIISTDDTLANIMVIRWLRQFIPNSAIVFCGNSIMTLYVGARQGFGLAPLPCWMGDNDPELTQVLPPIEEVYTQLWLLTHRDLRHTARVRSFIEAITKSIARDARLHDVTYSGWPAAANLP